MKLQEFMVANVVEISSDQTIGRQVGLIGDHSRTVFER